jgi:hypothetical protein
MKRGQKRTRAGWARPLWRVRRFCGRRSLSASDTTRTRPTTHVTLGSWAPPYGHALLSPEKLSLAGKYVQKSAPPSYTNAGSSSKEALLVKGTLFCQRWRVGFPCGRGGAAADKEAEKQSTRVVVERMALLGGRGR